MTTTKIDSLSKLRNVAEKGTVKRADSYKVRYSELRIKPGHNVRGIYLSQDDYWTAKKLRSTSKRWLTAMRTILKYLRFL